MLKVAKFFDFIAYIIVGALIALVYCFYEMLVLSPRGEDKVSKLSTDKY